MGLAAPSAPTSLRTGSATATASAIAKCTRITKPSAQGRRIFVMRFLGSEIQEIKNISGAVRLSGVVKNTIK